MQWIIYCYKWRYKRATIGDKIVDVIVYSIVISSIIASAVASKYAVSAWAFCSLVWLVNCHMTSGLYNKTQENSDKWRAKFYELHDAVNEIVEEIEATKAQSDEEAQGSDQVHKEEEA